MNNRQKTQEKVFSFIEEHGMITPGDKIVVGVSGGADSVCLLFVLLEYAEKVPLQLAVVHVDHGLRRDSGEDAEFVAQLCRQEDIPFYLQKVDVKAFAADRKLSQEEAGRQLRYIAFRETAKAFGANRIAVAHNGNDRAETMLFHLFRGSGLKGLCGIPPRREEIIRPLLCLERGEVEAYLSERGLSFRTDSTNLEDGYTRNRIRHHILPYAEQEVSTGTVAHMCRTADILSETEEYLEMQTLKAKEDCVEPSAADGSSRAVDVQCFGQQHIALRKRLLLTLLEELAPGRKDISAVHVGEVLSLFEKESNSRIDLPCGIRAVRRYDKVYLERSNKSDKTAFSPLYREVMLPSGETPEPIYLDLGVGGQVEISIFLSKNEHEIPINQCTKWFDCDKIKESLVFRYRQTGDFFSIADGRGGEKHKSLKDYMITEKIPRESRGSMPVLAEGHHVLWLVGHRISEYYKVGGNTKRILQVKLIGDCAGSRTEEKDGRAHSSTFVRGRRGRQDQDAGRTDQPRLRRQAGTFGLCAEGGKFFPV